jgi:class 3 adenylate cyclase
MAAQWGFDRDRMDEIDERDATILFINLPEYFKTLERLNSANLFERRKEFSTMVANIAHSFGGIIHDYQADALMIGFGTDVLHREPQHAVRAVETARQLQAGFQDLSKGWLDALEPEQLHLSAGICTGFVAVGFVGAARHKKSPAAIGDTTNVAARLLGAARKQGVDILISKPTYLGCQRWVEAEELPPVALKGKTHPVEIYAVRRVDWEVDGSV